MLTADVSGFLISIAMYLLLPIIVEFVQIPQSAGYGFAVGGSGNQLAPDFLVLNTVRPQPFVNTSVRFLNGFDYLYDADGGFVGYRWTGRVSQALGKVVPASPSN